ncbi:cytochrome c biogenesis CcdA family protein [Rhizobium sp. 0TCS1.26]|uniref:cytochrome c biogenesis CcdA family protein n=1 Tax=Rhizobium sp. 0TCS1.26 TaxID=3142623 RepID=UPI003D291F05
MVGSLSLAALAGLLSILSPCVLPLLPIVLTSAASKHRYGQLALALGLAGSFVAIGMFVATIGFGLGFDLAFFRSFAALMMIAFGLVLMAPSMQTRLAAAAGPVGNWAERRFGGFGEEGWTGQFLVGVLLGAVWSPCVGPTLGAASVMAAQGQNLGEVFLTMVAFGIGAATPLLLLGTLSREAMQRWRGRLMDAGKTMKIGLGLLLLLVGLAVLTGLDKLVETRLVELSPDWLTRLTTQF